ncbi:HipA N-terminal domain-containing protein [Runella sp.]|uniref:HipA N-terminal domain-containing protein n=1 Tax=Runella sp. TaxID=1960881 RepID=UPI00301641E5
MKAAIYYNQTLAGYLEKTEKGYIYSYYDAYLQSPHPPISFSFPKSLIVFESPTLFPFFSGLLSEGINKEIQCKGLKLDENDDFGRLLRTAGTETIGAITVKNV